MMVEGDSKQEALKVHAIPRFRRGGRAVGDNRGLS
jgi:hypothetical protein